MRVWPRAIVDCASAGGIATFDASASSARSTSSRRIELNLRDLVVALEFDVQARVRGVQGRLHGAERATHRTRDLVERKIGVVSEHERDALSSRELFDSGLHRLAVDDLVGDVWRVDPARAGSRQRAPAAYGRQDR